MVENIKEIRWHGGEKNTLKSFVVFKCDQWQVKQAGLQGNEMVIQKESTVGYYFISVREKESDKRQKAAGRNRHICKAGRVGASALQQGHRPGGGWWSVVVKMRKITDIKICKFQLLFSQTSAALNSSSPTSTVTSLWTDCQWKHNFFTELNSGFECLTTKPSLQGLQLPHQSYFFWNQLMCWKISDIMKNIRKKETASWTFFICDCFSCWIITCCS